MDSFEKSLAHSVLKLGILKLPPHFLCRYNFASLNEIYWKIGGYVENWPWFIISFINYYKSDDKI